MQNYIIVGMKSADFKLGYDLEVSNQHMCWILSSGGVINDITETRQ